MRIWLGFCLMVWVLGVGGSFASNRADINADGELDAEDLSILGNILAGNIDPTGYDMASVVVVAKQGGDFDDPADAADWVATQSPASYNRFVILVMPGSYTVMGPVKLPPYTSLVGTDRRNCILSIQLPGASVGVLEIVNADYVAVRNLQLTNSTYTMAPSSQTNVVYMRDSNFLIFDRVTMSSLSGGGEVLGLCAEWQENYLNELRVENCLIDLRSMNLASSRRVEGIKNSGGGLTLRNTVIEVTQLAASQFAIGISQDANTTGLSPISKAYGCEIRADAKTIGLDQAFYSYSSSYDTCRFYHCVLVGGLDSTHNVVAGCYDDLGNPR